jgi:hypothetical protein
MRRQANAGGDSTRTGIRASFLSAGFRELSSLLLRTTGSVLACTNSKPSLTHSNHPIAELGCSPSSEHERTDSSRHAKSTVDHDWPNARLAADPDTQGLLLGEPLQQV